MSEVLKSFDSAMQAAHMLRVTGGTLIKDAADLEARTKRDFGVSHVDREPGFACWQIEGLMGYFNSPREAIEAKFKGKKGNP